MEYVDGRDLRSIEQSAREHSVPLPVPLAVYVASKVASALDYAHRRRDAEGHELNIVHRDVSPQNILISYEGDIKLCDFGIAKAASKASKTQSGALKGKIQYMSPEQAWGKPIDRRSDLFSLGVVLHELLTGERLFHGDTDISVLEKVRSADIAPPSRSNPEVPQNLDAVVLRALAKDPDERYANASDLLRDLESVLYSYTPAPGSADVAIYLHRLQAEETAVAEAKAREAAAQAESVEVAGARAQAQVEERADRPADRCDAPGRRRRSGLRASGGQAARAGGAAPPRAAPRGVPRGLRVAREVGGGRDEEPHAALRRHRRRGGRARGLRDLADEPLRIVGGSGSREGHSGGRSGARADRRPDPRRGARAASRGRHRSQVRRSRGPETGRCQAPGAREGRGRGEGRDRNRGPAHRRA